MEQDLRKVVFSTLGLDRTVFLPAVVCGDDEVLNHDPFTEDEIDCYILADTRFSPLAWAE